MADIRINALATTAASTASDDFVAVDGSANGTRKLSAYSPTFGGNVSVTGTLGIGTSTPTYKFDVLDNSTGVQGRLSSSSSSGTSFALTNTATNGRIYRIGSNFVTGNGEFALYDDTASAVRLTVSSAGNTTLAGNLTVSGTGNSTFGGTVGIQVTPQSWYVSGGGGAGAALQIGSASAIYNYSSGSNVQTRIYNNAYLDSAAAERYITSATATKFELISGQFFWKTAASGTAGNAIVSWSDSMTLSTSGNLLLGTTTDSANGKLQLATHTTSAGGIGFGTDVSLFRAGTKLLNIAAATANYLAIQPDASTYNFQISTSGSDAGLRLTRQTVADWDITAGSSFIIKKDGTTALTLDSSQNATFAGTVTAGGNVNLAVGKLLTLNGNATAGSYALQAATGSAPYDFRFIGASDSGTQRYFSFGYYTGDNIANAWNEKARINSYTGDATFVGSIAIGNTVQTASSVASTHKVTIYIGGTAYYLLATNV
jgi:hypothetical protein